MEEEKTNIPFQCIKQLVLIRLIMIYEYIHYIPLEIYLHKFSATYFP